MVAAARGVALQFLVVAAAGVARQAGNHVAASPSAIGVAAAVVPEICSGYVRASAT